MPARTAALTAAAPVPPWARSAPKKRMCVTRGAAALPPPPPSAAAAAASVAVPLGGDMCPLAASTAALKASTSRSGRASSPRTPVPAGAMSSSATLTVRVPPHADTRAAAAVATFLRQPLPLPAHGRGTTTTRDAGARPSIWAARAAVMCSSATAAASGSCAPRATSAIHAAPSFADDVSVVASSSDRTP